jgi:amphi-Trp domain-containing protein
MGSAKGASKAARHFLARMCRGNVLARRVFCWRAMISKRIQDTMAKRERDIEKDYPLNQFVEKLRRLADAIEAGERFEIQVAGERVYVPARAQFNIEHERGEGEEEIEFQIKWENK